MSNAGRVKLLRNIIILFILFISGPLLASPFDAFTRCQDELAAGDIVAVKKSALELAQLVPSSQTERIELGLICLQGAYGSEWLYDANFGSFITVDTDVRLEFTNDLISLNTPKSLRYANRVESATVSAFQTTWKAQYADLEVEKIELQNHLTCAERELSQSQDNLEELALSIRAANNSIIELKTKNACERLNSSDPDAAILNPICRKWFQDTFHPDLELAEAKSKISIMTEKVRNHQGIVDSLQLPLALIMAKMAGLQMNLAGALKTESENTPSEYAVLDCSKYKN